MTALTNVLQGTLESTAAEHGVSEYLDQILAVAKPTLLLRVKPVDLSEIPAGKSFLGGCPDLASGMTWATEPESSLALDFLAQINLADLPNVGLQLPPSGLLLVYAQQEEADENQHSLQLVTAPASELTRAESPGDEGFADADGPSGSLLITDFIPSVSLPPSGDSFPEFPDDIHDAYSEMLSKLHDDPMQKEPTSRLFGYPSSEYESILPDESWQLLIQVESHFHDGQCVMNFWDAGCAQLLVKTADLASCEFSESMAMVNSM